MLEQVLYNNAGDYDKRLRLLGMQSVSVRQLEELSALRGPAAFSITDSLGTRPLEFIPRRSRMMRPVAMETRPNHMEVRSCHRQLPPHSSRHSALGDLVRGTNAPVLLLSVLSPLSVSMSAKRNYPRAQIVAAVSKLYGTEILRRCRFCHSISNNASYFWP